MTDPKEQEALEAVGKAANEFVIHAGPMPIATELQGVWGKLRKAIRAWNRERFSINDLENLPELVRAARDLVATLGDGPDFQGATTRTIKALEPFDHIES